MEQFAEVVVKMLREQALVVLSVCIILDKVVELAVKQRALLIVELHTPSLVQHVGEIILMLVVKEQVKVTLRVLYSLMRRLNDLLDDGKHVQQFLLGVCELLLDQEVVKLLLVHLDDFVEESCEFEVFLLNDFVDLILCNL